MGIFLRLRLSSMMFLQYFVWSMWYVTMGTYMIANLKAGATDIGSAYANFSIGAIISPFFIGLVSDRFFASQHVLGVLHIIGAIVLFFVGRTADLNAFWWLILLYTLLYAPTISLSNAVAFRHMENPARQFPAIRVMGTAGWIVAGLLIGYFGLDGSRLIFQIAAVGSIMLGAMSFALPHTPPLASVNTSLQSRLGLDALGLFKNNAFLLFFVVSILICIPLTFYYSFANPFLNDIGVANAAGKMTLGQLSEAAFMLAIPILFARLGVKWMLSLALICWVLRYLLFAFGDAHHSMWMLLVGIALHGACYDFFFVTGQIYTEDVAGKQIKNAAQGLITFATYGIGMFLGSYISGYLTERYVIVGENHTTYNWESVWLIPAYISAALLVLLLLFFNDKKKRRQVRQVL